MLLVLGLAESIIAAPEAPKVAPPGAEGLVEEEDCPWRELLRFSCAKILLSVMVYSILAGPRLKASTRGKLDADV